jgi:peptidoglycan-associated lipoprotein
MSYSIHLIKWILDMKKIAVVLSSLLVVACASTPKSDTSSVSQNTNSAPVTLPYVSTAETEAKKLAAEMQELQKQSIYFDYDQYTVKPEYQNILQNQAQFIKDHKSDIVAVEGNTDERGSSEYNLALGDKRANAARKNLELLGVPDAQINTVSLGEDKPRLTCHEEQCWQENRRVDFIHKLN